MSEEIKVPPEQAYGYIPTPEPVLESIKTLNIFEQVLGRNQPHTLPKPKTSRWRRNHTAMAEWHVKFHTISYPIQQGHHYYVRDKMPQIEVPKLIIDDLGPLMPHLTEEPYA